MNKLNFVIFFTIFLLIFFGANAYIYFHGLHALPAIHWLRTVYLIAFITLSVSFPLSRMIEKTALINTHHILYWLGAFWLAAVLYLLIMVVLVDLVRVANLVLHFLPDKSSIAYQNIKLTSFVLVAASVLGFLIYGHWISHHPHIVNKEITIHKQAGNRKELNIAMVSDIHLGALFNKPQVDEMVEKINILKPDLILLAGDILDEVQTPIYRNNTGEALSHLSAPLGVYGITGNHEYIGGAKRSVKYLESLGIKMLIDSAILVNNEFYLVGRNDKDQKNFAGKDRMPLNELVASINKNLPVILMDHQPFHLNDAVNNGVDLQLSGHTHNGQFWPFNLIVKRMFEVSHGHKQKGTTHIYVSCGYGYWGPPIRTGSTPEIVHLKLVFAPKI